MPDTHTPIHPAPVLETERLILRGHGLGDYAESAALWADPEVTRFIGGRPFTGEEVWIRLLRHVGHWWLLGYGVWAVHEKASGRFVGEVGFANLRRDIDPPMEDPEIGWVLSPWSHGRGFATEAARAAVAWGDARLAAQRTLCMIDPDNLASIGVAKKCGYREYARPIFKGNAVVLYERPGAR